MQETLVRILGWEDHLEKEKVPTPVFLGFPCGSVGKESACNAGDTGDNGSIPGLGKYPRGGNGNPIQYSCLENPMNGEAWSATALGVTKSQT